MTPAQRLLLSLRDFIGDALAEPDITPSDIVEAIRDELLELQDYHKIQSGKIDQLLNLIRTSVGLSNFNSYLKTNEMDIADDLDKAIRYYKGGCDGLPGMDSEDLGIPKDITDIWKSKGKRYRKMDDK